MVSKPGASTAAVSQGEVTADASSEAGIVEPGSRPSLDDTAGRVCFSLSLCSPSPVVAVNYFVVFLFFSFFFLFWKYKKNLPSFVHGPQFLFYVSAYYPLLLLSPSLLSITPTTTTPPLSLSPFCCLWKVF